MIKRLQDYISENEYKDAIEEADDSLKSKMAYVQALIGSDGYNVIKEYWTGQVNIARERLRTMKTMDDLTEVQTRYKLAEDFLNYLEYMETIRKD